MTIVRQLRPRDAALVDPLAIRALFARLGPQDAEASIISDTTELTDLMRALDRDVQESALSAICMRADRAHRLARDLGFVALTHVLGALADASRGGDMVALAAIWARAKRIGDTSLVDLWELPQLRM